MIKAVIFDCFGVLVREGWFAFLDDYFAHDEDKLRQAVDGMSRMGSGLMAHDDFIVQMAELAGISYQETEDILTDNPANDQLFDYIENTLKPHYMLGILSNAGADRTNELFGHQRAALFDTVVLSHQLGMIKPDPKIYEIAAERLGVEPSECLFVDDQQRHCEGALKVGMQAIQFIDTGTTITKIKEALDA